MVRKNFKKAGGRVFPILDQTIYNATPKMQVEAHRSGRGRKRGLRSGLVRYRKVQRVFSEHLRVLSALDEYQGFRISTAHSSFWMQRFFNSLTLVGKKKTSSRLLAATLWGLSQVFYEDPLMLLFEFFELYRYPFLAVQVNRG